MVDSVNEPRVLLAFLCTRDQAEEFNKTGQMPAGVYQFGELIPDDSLVNKTAMATNGEIMGLAMHRAVMAEKSMQ